MQVAGRRVTNIEYSEIYLRWGCQGFFIDPDWLQRMSQGFRNRDCILILSSNRYIEMCISTCYKHHRTKLQQSLSLLFSFSFSFFFFCKRALSFCEAQRERGRRIGWVSLLMRMHSCSEFTEANKWPPLSRIRHERKLQEKFSAIVA